MNFFEYTEIKMDFYMFLQNTSSLKKTLNLI